MLEKEVLNFEKTAIVGIVTQNQSEEKLNEIENAILIHLEIEK